VSITLVVTLVLASGGLCSALTTFAYDRLPGRRLHREEQRKPMGAELRRRGLVNAVCSTVTVFGYTHILARWLFTAEAPSPWRGAVQVVLILALYDILYYFLHRYLFHEWTLLRPVHAVHHRVRYPVSVESLFLHPLEGFLGLSLLVFCTWVVGPVHPVAFGACFFVYTWLNIIVHAGVALPIPYLALIARKHARHHVDMRAGNYASISPLPDLLFGTSE
jgi:sterol desaturase/sphingolipid hydroxylase (fatty acid hydroxylase superfamily)